jgi:hypothetical protein
VKKFRNSDCYSIEGRNLTFHPSSMADARTENEGSGTRKYFILTAMTGGSIGISSVITDELCCEYATHHHDLRSTVAAACMPRYQHVSFPGTERPLTLLSHKVHQLGVDIQLRGMILHLQPEQKRRISMIIECRSIWGGTDIILCTKSS